MSNDFDAILQDSLYGILGNDEAELAPATGSPITLEVIDETKGVEIQIGEGPGQILTVKPACSVRISTLTENSITREDLPGGTVLLNGTVWRIEGTLPRPGFNGQPSGQLRLLLVEDA